MNADELRKLLVKVGHLRNLAARAGTLAEGEAAAAQADAIIAKYRIAEAALESAGSADGEVCSEEIDPLMPPSGRIERWVVSLAAGLSRHYGCYCYIHVFSKVDFAGQSRRMSALRVVGRSGDVQIFRTMFAWLRLEITRLAKGERYKTAFKLGAQNGYLAALKASTAAEVKASGTSGAMVLISRADAAKALAHAAHTLSGRRTSSPGVNADAYHRGQSAGAGLVNTGTLATASGRLLGA